MLTLHGLGALHYSESEAHGAKIALPDQLVIGAIRGKSGGLLAAPTRSLLGSGGQIRSRARLLSVSHVCRPESFCCGASALGLSVIRSLLTPRQLCIIMKASMAMQSSSTSRLQRCQALGASCLHARLSCAGVRRSRASRTVTAAKPQARSVRGVCGRGAYL